VEASDLALFIHIQPYFYFGSLVIHVDKSDSNFQVKGRPGDCLSFVNASITVKLTDSSNTCSVSIFLISFKYFNLIGIYEKSVSSANVSFVPGQQNYAWFFDFDSNPRLKNIGTVTSLLLYNKSAKSVSTVPLSDFNSDNRMFILLSNATSKQFSTVKFTTDQKLCDWNEHDGRFRRCLNSTCEKIMDRPLYVTVERKVTPWIWIGIGCFCFVTAVVGILLLMIPRKPKGSKATAAMISIS
jgi:hypothetical protein